LTDTLKRYGGYLMKTEGDAYKIAFTNAADAVHCAVLAQAALQRYPWPQDVGGLQVRMAVHSGKPIMQAGDYFGPPVNRTARILSTVHGGQIVISGDSADQASGKLQPNAELVDLGQHQLRDLDAPVQLHQVRHTSLPQQQFPPPNSLNKHAHNLPRQRTSFIGREDEIEQIVALFARDDTPVLTLTGPEGVGKTRLTLQAAAERIEWFPDGVWFVRLGEAATVEGAAGQIAQQIGIKVEAGLSALESVQAWLHDRRCLLILDDAGESPEAASLIREILSEAHGLRCVATSRESLHLKESAEIVLGGLGTPNEEATTEELLATDSGRLFVERVAEERSDLEVNDKRSRPIARLLGKLGGMPGQIEKAAKEMRKQHGSFASMLEHAAQSVAETARDAGKVASSAGNELMEMMRKAPSLDAFIEQLGASASTKSEVEEAERLCRDALKLYELQGNRDGVAKQYWQLGKLAFMQGDFQRASMHLDASLSVLREIGSDQREAVAADLALARREAQATGVFGHSSVEHATG
jgi:hypothetical protein